MIIRLVYGKIYRKPPYLMVKTMVSCGFSLKPIQSHVAVVASKCFRTRRHEGICHNGDLPPGHSSEEFHWKVCVCVIKHIGIGGTQFSVFAQSDHLSMSSVFLCVSWDFSAPQRWLVMIAGSKICPCSQGHRGNPHGRQEERSARGDRFYVSSC